MTPKTVAQRFNRADLIEQIRLAMPLARERILYFRLDGADDDSVLGGIIEKLVGHAGPPTVRDDEYARLEESWEAAYALGIAVGLLLDPALIAGGSVGNKRSGKGAR